MADAGPSVPPGIERIGLAVSPGRPPMLDAARVIASELQVVRVVLASDVVGRDRSSADRIAARFSGTTVEQTAHDDFKARL